MLARSVLSLTRGWSVVESKDQWYHAFSERDKKEGRALEHCCSTEAGEKTLGHETGGDGLVGGSS